MFSTNLLGLLKCCASASSNALVSLNVHAAFCGEVSSQSKLAALPGTAHTGAARHTLVSNQTVVRNSAQAPTAPLHALV